MRDMKVDDGVYIRKGKWGYRLIYPYKNEDGSINWFNTLTGGSWGNLIKVGVVVALILASVWAYKHDMNTLIEQCKHMPLIFNP